MQNYKYLMQMELAVFCTAEWCYVMVYKTGKCSVLYFWTVTCLVLYHILLWNNLTHTLGTMQCWKHSYLPKNDTEQVLDGKDSQTSVHNFNMRFKHHNTYFSPSNNGQFNSLVTIYYARMSEHNKIIIPLSKYKLQV